MLNRIRLGDDVDTYCGRCKEERRHQVVALHSENRIERVACNFCRTAHLYRDQSAKAAKPRAAGGVRRTEVKSRPALGQPARPYSVQATYAVGEQITHPKFGQGEVVEARQGKIDVRFGKELRTFLHAG